MIIEDKDSLFYGHTESLQDVVGELKAILMSNNDEHTVVSCLSVMSAMATLDFVEIQAMMEDIKGIDDLVRSSIYQCTVRAEAFLIASREGV